MNLFRKYVLHNLALKLGSLALAFLLWTAITKEPPVEVAFSAPLEFRNLPQDLELSSETPTAVQVRVRGPASAVRRLSPSDLAVSVDLADFRRPGERSYPLAVSELKAPIGVRVAQIIPAQARVRFEARAQRDLPVAPRILGSSAPGYRLAGYQVFPPMVRVVGPESHVAALESASTDPVDVSGVLARAQFWTNVFVSDPLVRIQSQQQVRVTVQMERRR